MQTFTSCSVRPRASRATSLAALLIVGVHFGPLTIRAANVASDNASNYSDGSNFDGQNQGTGFSAFSFNYQGGGYRGGFITSSGNSQVAVGGRSFDIYGTQSGRIDVTRPFTADAVSGSANLAVGQTFRADFDNSRIDNVGSNLGNPDSVGFYLTGSSGARLAFTFTGGEANYGLTDGTGRKDTGINFSDQGFRTALTLTDVDAYSFSVTRLSDQQTFTFTGLLAGAAGSGINSVVFFDNNAGDGQDVFFNSLSIEGMPVPEPSTVIAGGLVSVALGLSVFRRVRRRGELPA